VSSTPNTADLLRAISDMCLDMHRAGFDLARATGGADIEPKIFVQCAMTALAETNADEMLQQVGKFEATHGK